MLCFTAGAALMLSPLVFHERGVLELILGGVVLTLTGIVLRGVSLLRDAATAQGRRA
jgi:hypothetical protein